jgi:hypothetical protein
MPRSLAAMPVIPLLLLATAVAMALTATSPRTDPRPSAVVEVSYPGK